MKWLTEKGGTGSIYKYNLDKIDVIEISYDERYVKLITYIEEGYTSVQEISSGGVINYDEILKIAKRITL
jgi:hypothetical protein